MVGRSQCFGAHHARCLVYVVGWFGIGRLPYMNRWRRKLTTILPMCMLNNKRLVMVSYECVFKSIVTHKGLR